MTYTVDRRIAELLCSRICHELVAGIAAINNGVELISEIDSSMLDETMGLIGSSARQASVKVQYYRMAYGFAGHDALSGMSDVAGLIEGLLESETRFTLKLQDNPPPLEAGWGKLLLNLCVLGMDCLPRGGAIAPAVTAGDGRTEIAVIGQGEEARLSDRHRDILTRAVAPSEVTALNVHAYYTSALANDIGGGLDIDLGNGAVSLKVRV
jgi:histidine phosphotransferase ChpT